MSPIHIVVVRCRLVLQISLGHIDDRKQGDTIGMKLSHLARSFLPRKQTPVTPPNRDDSLLPTYPSDLKKFKERQVDREAYDRDHQHYVAFLVPVPLILWERIPVRSSPWAGWGMYKCTCLSPGCSFPFSSARSRADVEVWFLAREVVPR